jgi:hypothetical protein
MNMAYSANDGKKKPSMMLKTTISKKQPCGRWQNSINGPIESEVYL